MTGEEWVATYCEKFNLKWEELSIPERRRITCSIPCAIRCWRVGVAVEGKPGEPCEECGSPHPIPNAWQRIILSD